MISPLDSLYDLYKLSRVEEGFAVIFLIPPSISPFWQHRGMPRSTSPSDSPAASDLASSDALGAGLLQGESGCQAAKPVGGPAVFPETLLTDLDQDLNRLQRTIRRTIQDKLMTLAGLNFGSLDANQQFVSKIAVLLDSHGLRVRCCECGHPAILRVSPRGNSTGVFVFDHSIHGRRTFHGGKAHMPRVQLVNKPPRKRPEKKQPEKKPA